jgi:hypothetical protein
MPLGRLDRRLSYIVLFVGLVVVTVVFGVRAQYAPGVYYSLAVVQLTVISIAAWKLGASAVRAEAQDHRTLAVAGILLIAPFASFSFLAGFGPPWLATAPENQLRFTILLIDAIAIAGGLVLLREALSKAGERFYSALGFAAIMLAGPLYAIFAAIQLGFFRAIERAGPGQESPGISSLDELSLILIYVGAVLTYLATAAFAAALGRTQWLGRTASRAFVGASLLAVLCAGIKVAEALASPENSMWGFERWYTAPGFALMIPAVPWIMPYLFGVGLLRRAGDAQR